MAHEHKFILDYIFYLFTWIHSWQFRDVADYIIPKCKALDEYKGFIDALPMADSPETFGLHPNADIT
jgi:dynein heavy chain, axonemal